ncbi:uncharacterized protein M6B38_299440 [Iris pallida]|uniref:C2H2-type domain-containing protein n=1 Tax=Iris pallida TaxID=29817 RepID=A0AAX6HPF9_IRIPA|nr:uncharacterized protein M6B38_299440 [Iris pallida]
MSADKLRTYKTPDAMKPEEKITKTEEGQDTLDNVIRQAVGKDPFLSFSRAGDSPVRWIQLLHALEQQGSDKISRSSTVEKLTEGKEHPVGICNGANSFASEMNGVKESVHSLGGNGNYVKGTKSTSEQMQSLKIPEAVAAFAQAAAKANGEPEKYLPGWPLLSPSKVQLQKCSKCSLEFCSAINYRRHMRVHRRALNIVKDSSKTRNLLAAFWDKLSLDEAKELVSFHNETVEGVAGSSIIRALTSWIQKPGFLSLPQKYVNAGVTLLDVVHARPSIFPMTSQNLFSVLDDASEKTFLIAGTALSSQKYVFDSEAGKNALEMKNLVACTSFLLEQMLVKAWVADKDAEALRCQKLLVEEEEAAQKRHAELLERKRLKKLRQREQKAREQSDADAVKTGSKVNLSDSAEGTSSSGSPSPRAQSESDTNISDISLSQVAMPMDSAGFVDPDSGENLQLPFRKIVEQSAGHWIQKTSGCLKSIPAQRLLLKQNRNVSSGFSSGQFPAGKSLVIAQSNYREPKAPMLANSHKVWTRKLKTENQTEVTNGVIVNREQSSDSSELLIGSISVALGEANGQQLLNVLRKDSFQEKVKTDSGGAGLKLWRPVDHQKGCFATSHTNMSDAREMKENGIPAEISNLASLNMGHLASDGMDNVRVEKNKDSLKVYSGTNFTEPKLFSSEAAEAFLAQRWKEAIAADHVKLILSPVRETSTFVDSIEEHHPEAQAQLFDRLERSILGSAENRMTGVGLIGPAACASKPKFRQKHEKSVRLQYVPKQRSNI